MDCHVANKIIPDLNTTDIQITSTCRCFKYLQANWSGVLLTDDIKHIIALPFKGYVLVEKDNDLMLIET